MFVEISKIWYNAYGRDYMGQKNILYNNNLDKNFILNDTSHKDVAMSALQQKKRKFRKT